MVDAWGDPARHDRRAEEVRHARGAEFRHLHVALRVLAGALRMARSRQPGANPLDVFSDVYFSSHFRLVGLVNGPGSLYTPKGALYVRRYGLGLQAHPAARGEIRDLRRCRRVNEPDGGRSPAWRGVPACASAHRPRTLLRAAAAIRLWSKSPYPSGWKKRRIHGEPVARRFAAYGLHAANTLTTAARDSAVRQNDPCQEAAGHSRGISRCLV